MDPIRALLVGPIAAVTALAAISGCADDQDQRPASWSYISATIIQPSCATAGCHSRLTATGGLELDGRESGYPSLVGGLQEGAESFVVPGQPDQSQLMYQLRGIETRRMPPDQPLPDADIELIERWILEGARFD